MKWLLVLIFLLGSFLRFYKIDDYLFFGGDEGMNLLLVRDYLLKNQIPLFGPTTSLSWIHLGPFSYYLWMLVLRVGKFNPLSVAYTVSFFDSLTIFTVYLLGKKLFSLKTALIASLLYAVSPYNIIHSRTPIHVSLAPFFGLLFLFFLISFLSEKRKIYFFVSCFFLSLATQIHLTGVIMILFFLVYTIKRINIKDTALGIFIFLLPYLTYLYGDYLNKFTLTTKLLLWFPYRVLSAFGVFTSKNLLTGVRLINILQTWGDFLRQAIIIVSIEIAVVLFFISIVSIFRSRFHSYSCRFIIFFIIIYILAIFLQGQPSSHFFLFLTPMIFILVGKFLSQDRIKILFGGFFIMINLFSLFTSRFYVNIPYSEILRLTDYFIADSKDKSYWILCPPDFTASFYCYDNIRYLGWFLGKEPVKSEDSAQYILYMRKTNIVSPKEKETRIDFPNTVVMKIETL